MRRLPPSPAKPSCSPPPTPNPTPNPNPQELTTLVYAYARMHHRVPAVLARIANKVGRHLDLLKPQDAAMLMWGFAKLAFKPGPLLLDRLPLAVVGRLSDFRPQVCALRVCVACALHVDCVCCCAWVWF